MRNWSSILIVGIVLFFAMCVWAERRLDYPPTPEPQVCKLLGAS